MTAGLLRRAAAHLERLAADATPGPWSWEAREDWGFGNWHTITGSNGQDVAQGGYEGGGVESAPDARWIAALSPELATPLAAWLRSAARTIDATNPDACPSAVAFARALLVDAEASS